MPWIEVDNRQSNFDETTRQVRRRVRRRRDQRRQGRPLPADLLEGATSVRASALPTTSTATASTHRARRLRRLLELHARRHVVVEGAEPAVPAVDGAERRSVGLRRTTCCSRTVCRRLRASIRTRAGRGHDAVDLRHQLPRRLRAAVEHQRPARLRAPTTCWRSPTSGRRAGRC